MRRSARATTSAELVSDLRLRLDLDAGGDVDQPQDRLPGRLAARGRTAPERVAAWAVRAGVARMCDSMSIMRAEPMVQRAVDGDGQIEHAEVLGELPDADLRDDDGKSTDHCVGLFACARPEHVQARPLGAISAGWQLIRAPRARLVAEVARARTCSRRSGARSSRPPAQRRRDVARRCSEQPRSSAIEAGAVDPMSRPGSKLRDRSACG